MLGVMVGGGRGGFGMVCDVEIADFIQHNRRAIQIPWRESRDAVLHYSGFAAPEKYMGYSEKKYELKEKRTRNQQRFLFYCWKNRTVSIQRERVRERETMCII